MKSTIYQQICCNQLVYNLKKTDINLVDQNGVRQRIKHGWNSPEMQIGPYYVDGYAIVDGKQIIYEFNGCAYHSCVRCKPVRINQNEEERKFFFKNLPNSKIVDISSCEWYAQKCDMDIHLYEPEISPLLLKKTVKECDIIGLVMEDRIYGFAVVDLRKQPEAQKWSRLNWPPIMQKEEILLEDISPWMRSLFDKSEFPKESIVQKMSADKLLLHTDLLKFYIENGFAVSKMYKFFEYEGSRCFENVYEKIYNARVEATEIGNSPDATDEEKAEAEMKATCVKLVSNSMYGSTLLVSFINC